MRSNPFVVRFVPILLVLIAGASANAQTAAKVFAKAKNAVVTIDTPTGSGTGFIIGNGTLLVTCFHVVEGNTLSDIEIELPGVRVELLLYAMSDQESSYRCIFCITFIEFPSTQVIRQNCSGRASL